MKKRNYEIHPLFYKKELLSRSSIFIAFVFSTQKSEHDNDNDDDDC